MPRMESSIDTYTSIRMIVLAESSFRRFTKHQPESADWNFGWAVSNKLRDNTVMGIFKDSALAGVV